MTPCSSVGSTVLRAVVRSVARTTAMIVPLLLCSGLLCRGAIAGELSAAGTTAAPALEEVLVLDRFDALQRSGSGSRIEAGIIADTRAEHVHELLLRVPGVLVSRGSGQEHLTAIRSAVLTGAGSCGAFLLLENGVSIRPHGTCNANGLFEAQTELANAVWVVRGPASALYGGNALHGAIDVRLPDPDEPSRQHYELEAGRWGFGQLRASLPIRSGDERQQSLRIDALGTRTNGWREDTGFGEQKLLISHGVSLGDWRVRNYVSGTNLNQETGGFVTGRDAYRHSDVNDGNPNPEAFRDAWSARLLSQWANEDLHVDAYLRRSKMRFLQHCLLGQPLERNGQTSAGLQGTQAWSSGALDIRVGAQLEWATSDLAEIQAKPATGSAAAVGIRPIGVHYDYEVDSRMYAAFYDGEFAFTDSWSLVHSGRFEHLAYDYTNEASDGNLRPNGTACGFGGCLFNRPAAREDNFNNWAGRLGIRYETESGNASHLAVSTGFRAPQTTELYRLQRGQNVADLDSERLYAIEAGTSQQVFAGAGHIDLVAYWQRKQHFILRDAAGFNVSDGRTRGAGAELSVQLKPEGLKLEFDLALAYSKLLYDFDRNIAGGEVIRKGNDEDTAPRWLGSAQWRWTPTPAWRTELELIYEGAYEIDAANTADYPGHTLINLRADWRLSPQLSVFGRVMNLTDREYADRADIAFGTERYFPGEPRRAFVGITYSPTQ